jgi:hypothetical protein
LMHNDLYAYVLLMLVPLYVDRRRDPLTIEI